MKLDPKPLKDYAEEYLKQIRQADDDVALDRIREFGAKAFERGYREAMARVVAMVEPLSR